MYKGPIIEILHSFSSKEANEISNGIYEYFCYNTKDLFRQTSLGIPVYYYSENINIKYKENEKFILLLIDDFLMLDDSLQNKCLYLISKNNSDIKTTIIPILISDAGINLVKKINSIPLYSIVDYDIKIKTLFYEVTRITFQKLKENTEKIKIFISYCRQDGEDIAHHLCNYINTRTHLSTILDTTSIEIHDNFQKEIENLLSVSSVIFLCTDKYSSRFWCLEEVLYSKKYDVPSIIVDAISEFESRRFPYLGNTSVIRWRHTEQTILDIINKLLFETLKQKLLKDISCINLEKNQIYFSHYPELANIAFMNQSTKLVFYPDPPLGISEIRFLENYSNCKFYTPITYQGKLNDQNLKICISISKPSDLNKVNCFDNHINYIYLEILRYLIYSKYIVVYGGDWRKGGYTEYIYDLIRVYQDNQELLEYKFTNYLAFPFYSELDSHTEALIRNVTNLIKIDPPFNNDRPLENYDNKSFIAYSLTNMRNVMLDNIDAIIAIAGKNESGNSILSGVLEEIIIAIKLKKPIYIIGGLGGVAKKIAEFIRNGEKFEPHIDFNVSSNYKNYIPSWTGSEYINILNGITYDSLNNGLNETENNILFESSNPCEIIPLILKGLSQL